MDAAPASVATAAAADAVALRIAVRAAAAAPRSLDLRSAIAPVFWCVERAGGAAKNQISQGDSAVINSALALRSPACTDLLLQCNALISEIHFRRHSLDNG